MDQTTLLAMDKQTFEARAGRLTLRINLLLPSALILHLVTAKLGGGESWFWPAEGVAFVALVLGARFIVLHKRLVAAWTELHPDEVAASPVDQPAFDGPQPLMRRGFILGLLGFFLFILGLLALDVIFG